MLRTTLRNLLAHKLRLLTTGLAVTIGVAFMSGTLILSATMARTFDGMYATAYDGVDGLVRAESTSRRRRGWRYCHASTSRWWTPSPRWTASAAAEGDIWGAAQVVGHDGNPVGNPGMGPPTIGTSWPVGEFNPWTLVARRPPRPTTRSSSTRRRRATPATPPETGPRCSSTVPPST